MPAPTTLPADLILADPEGRPVQLQPLLARHPLTVVQLVRYFGCLPCQEWAVDLDRQAPSLADRGIGALVLGGSADYQAQWLHEARGVSIPLLLDPGHQVRDAVGAGQALGLRLLDPRGATAYARSLRRGYRPRAITRDTVRSPGVVIVDSDGAVRWRHVGRRIGDYPAMDVVLRAAAKLR